jgi:allantoin racemase
MGYKFGVVTISPYNIYEQEHTIAKYGLTERLAGIRPNPETGDEQAEALIDARHAIESFKKVGRELIADGAEVLIPGCGLLSPALRLAPGAEKEYPNGLTQVDGVPIVDVMGDTIKMAETMVSLKRAGSCWISRKGLHAQATAQALECGRMVLKDDGPGFWDIS